MSQYPVDSNQGVYDAVNYLLSGPSGLGQNFSGFSSASKAFITGNNRTPFTSTSIQLPMTGSNGTQYLYASSTTGLQVNMKAEGPGVNALSTITTVNSSNVQLSFNLYANVNSTVYFTTYVPLQGTLALASTQWLDNYHLQCTYATTYSTPPISLGAPVTLSGVSIYDGTYSPVGAVQSTTTGFVVRSINSIYNFGTITGGTASFSYNNNTDTKPLWLSTDCTGLVTINGNTDRVFLTAQLNGVLSGAQYGETTIITVAINRYKNYASNDPTSAGTSFIFDKTIIQDYIYSTSSAGSVTILTPMTFSSVIDQPPQGYYWYRLEVACNYITQLNSWELGSRCLTAQVVKQ